MEACKIMILRNKFRIVYCINSPILTDDDYQHTSDHYFLIMAKWCQMRWSIKSGNGITYYSKIEQILRYL